MHPGTSHLRPSQPGTGVLVIGGTGFLGRAISRALVAAGREVHSLTRRPDLIQSDPLDGNIVRHTGDATRERDLLAALGELPTVVCAFGAVYPASPGRGDAPDPIALALEHLATRGGDCDLTVVSSGGSVYGEGTATPFRESAQLRPTTDYGVRMAAMEATVMSSRRGATGSTRILRVGNAYGRSQRLDRDQGFLGHAIASARAGRPIVVYGDGSAIRDYVTVADVAYAVNGLAGTADSDGLINVGSGTGSSLLDCIGLLEVSLGRSLPRHHVPRRSCDLQRSVLNVDRLASLVPWNPVGLKEGVDTLVRNSGDRNPAGVLVPST